MSQALIRRRFILQTLNFGYSPAQTSSATPINVTLVEKIILSSQGVVVVGHHDITHITVKANPIATRLTRKRRCADLGLVFMAYLDKAASIAH